MLERTSAPAAAVSGRDVALAPVAVSSSLDGRVSDLLAGEVEAAGLTIPKVDGGGEMVEAGGGEATGDGLPGDGVEAVC